MDGEPVPNAKITFFPRPEGRMSIGRTDEKGQYELIYTRDQKGALIGEHMVQITTAVDTGDYGEIAKEIIPVKYNLDGTLMKQVEGGNNVIDFDLESGGGIVQTDY